MCSQKKVQEVWHKLIPGCLRKKLMRRTYTQTHYLFKILSRLNQIPLSLWANTERAVLGIVQRLEDKREDLIHVIFPETDKYF